MGFIHLKILESIRQTGLLGSLEPNQAHIGFGVQPISREVIDVDFAKFHIEYCQRNHHQIRRISTSSLFYRVIDCQKKSIAKALEACTYVALSYV